MGFISTDKRRTSRFNWTLLFLIAGLLIVGCINLYSATYIWGDSGIYSLVWSQIVWIGLGLLLMLFLAFFDYRLIERVGVYIFIASIIMLILVLVAGKTVAGHKSWLAFGGMALQPSEFAKLALVIILSKYFSTHPHPEGVSLFDLWRPILLTLLPAGLVMLQGDLGSAIFFILIFVTYAWVGRIRGRWIAIMVMVAIIGSLLMYFFFLSNYQKARITTFVNPAKDARGSGYHLIQSRIAVGSGGIFGKGYLKGNINKLKYLPEKHTDFVFPVFAEEWGFVGSMAVITLYLLLFLTGIDIARNARDRTGTFLAVGVVAFIFWQVVINLSGVLGLMPLTGVTLPFMSYGGSSIIITLGSTGILFSVSMRRFLF